MKVVWGRALARPHVDYGRVVSQILFLIAICLSDLTRSSSDAGRVIAAYLILLPMGFAVPPTSLSERWAFTPPFHLFPACAR